MRGYLLLLPLLFALLAFERGEVTALVADDKAKAEKAGSARDWASWRGPEQNGVSRERDLPEKFSVVKKENVIFAVPHGSISSPIVLNNTVYLLGKAGEGATQQERVMAFDADTGKLKWEKKYNVWHTDIVEDRIGFTNMVGDVETGNVYAHLTSGEFICFDKDGKELWKRSTGEEFGRVSGYGGRVTSPIIDEDKVILAMPNASWGELTVGQIRMVAFDKKTGQIIWWGSGNYRVKDTYYSTPTVAVIRGERIIITGGGDGCVHAFQARTGKKVWTKKIEDGGGAINCSAVVQGDKVWIGHGEENTNNGTQGRIVCLDAGKIEKGEPKEVWRHDGVKVKFASPILNEGLLYVCDEAGKLYCFDAEKGGEPLWDFKFGTTTKGSPVLADGKIYIPDVDSKFNILKPTKDGCTRLQQVRFRGKGVVPVELHGSPAVVNGRVYFTTTEQFICIGKPDHKATPDKIPEGVKETGQPGEATHLQIVPADVTLKPGEGAEFKTVTYDDKGKRVGEAKAEWTKSGMRPPVWPIGITPPKPLPGAPPVIGGDLDAGPSVSAKFTSAKMPNGAYGTIVAKAGKLTGEARVRITPVLTYTQDFSKVPEGRTPAGWVNTMGKFSVVKGPDGKPALFKRNDNPSPPVARVNAYITGFDASDYTIESDVYSTKVRGKDQGDIGVGAMRYTLFLIGNDQELRLVTWDAQKRIEKKIPFPWKDETWYTMRLMATVKDGKGIVKGKVWPRGGKEPAEWTIEIEDPVPNTEGAALIYAFPNGTLSPQELGPAIYFANLKITPNGKK